MKRRCVCCKTMFRPDRYHPYQNYCSKDECQKSRRMTWQKNKLKTDPDYRKSQAEAQALWKTTNPEYWKNYRATHPEYVTHNRIMQQQRRSKGNTPVFAKQQPDVVNMDFASLQQRLLSGNYKLTIEDIIFVVKMYLATVQVAVLEPVTKTG